MVTDGESEEARTPIIEPLLQAMQAHLDQDEGLMESLRETSVLLLANEKLQAARKRHQDEQADGLVQRYSRRAVVGATGSRCSGIRPAYPGGPGNPVVERTGGALWRAGQGFTDRLLPATAEGKVKNMSAITLAIAGNALKAFRESER